MLYLINKESVKQNKCQFCCTYVPPRYCLFENSKLLKSVIKKSDFFTLLTCIIIWCATCCQLGGGIGKLWGSETTDTIIRQVETPARELGRNTFGSTRV